MKVAPAFKQILIAPWEGSEKLLNYSIVALSEDGRVFTYLKKRGGWSELSGIAVESDDDPRRRHQP